MKKRIGRGRRWAAAAITMAATALAVAVVLPTAAKADGTKWGADYFPNVLLTTHEGKVVHFYDDLIKGKTVAIDLIYTTCKYACPLETARLVQVQRVLGNRVGRDIFFYSITIDPDHDTPEVLAEYARKYGVGPGWLFLTATAADVELISRKLGLYSAPDPDDPDGHTPMLLVGNEPTGQWMRNSALDNPRFLARTVSDWLDGWRDGAKTAQPSFADVRDQPFDRGEYTFRNHCSACHTIGGGRAIGPDLRGVTTTRDHAWLSQFIVRPDKLLAENDPIARGLFEEYGQVRMPSLSLTTHDAEVLIDYIARESGVPRAATGGESKPMPSMAGMPDTPPARSGVTASPSHTPPPAASVTALLDAYLRLHAALAGDSLDGVRASALAIANETVTIGSPAAAIRVGINPFAQVTDLRSAREAFGGLSDAMIAFLNGALPDGIAVAYCPMARKSWLQRGDAIQNPYYGRAMADCGRIGGAPK